MVPPADRYRMSSRPMPERIDPPDYEPQASVRKVQLPQGPGRPSRCPAFYHRRRGLRPLLSKPCSGAGRPAPEHGPNCPRCLRTSVLDVQSLNRRSGRGGSLPMDRRIGPARHDPNLSTLLGPSGQERSIPTDTRLGCGPHRWYTVPRHGFGSPERIEVLHESSILSGSTITSSTLSHRGSPGTVM